MRIPSTFRPKKSATLTDPDLQDLSQLELAERFRKTLYYGKTPTTDRPSLPMTELAVDFFRDASPDGLGCVDTYWASSVGRRACVSPCSMMLGMVYIERLKNRNPEYLQNTPSSDLFLISMMVASKYLYDEGVDEEVFNDEWAESAKIEVDEINEMERDFLAAIDWSVFVKADEFWTALVDMEQRIALKEGIDRGFFTYTDLAVLSSNVNTDTLKNALSHMCKVMLVCCATYTAGVVVLVASVATLSCIKSTTSLVNLHHTATLSPDEPTTLVESHLPADPSYALDFFSPNTNGSSDLFLPDAVTPGTEAVTGLGGVMTAPRETGEAVRRPSVPFTGLFTLTLIRDTVLLFLKSVSDSSHYPRSQLPPRNDDETNTHLLGGVCTCVSNDRQQRIGMMGCAACGNDGESMVDCCGGVRCGLCQRECRQRSALLGTGSKPGVGHFEWRSKVTSPPFADVTIGFHTAPPVVVATRRG